VINDASFKIMLITKHIWGYKALIIHVETAFFHGYLTEDIYVNIPKGMNEDQDHCLKLKRTIYGLVQSATEFYKKLILVIKSIGLVENKSDPYLLSNRNWKHVILIRIYIDDCLVIRKEERIQW
jgi:hypothetical protein